MNLGKRVARLRRSRGESLREAASRTGISHSTIARIEKGEVSSSLHETLRRIADAYGVRLEYLLGRKSGSRTLVLTRQLTPEERTALLFSVGRDRVRQAVALVAGGQAGRISRRQLAEVLGVAVESLADLVEQVDPGDPLLERLCHLLAQMTGLPPGWFSYDPQEERDSPPAAEARAYIALVEKAAGAGLDPNLVGIAIDLMQLKDSIAPEQPTAH